jgi:hypothetical protein
MMASRAEISLITNPPRSPLDSAQPYERSGPGDPARDHADVIEHEKLVILPARALIFRNRKMKSRCAKRGGDCRNISRVCVSCRAGGR